MAADEPWLPCLHVKTRRGYELGHAIGKWFRGLIHSRFASDPALHSELLPFAATEDGEKLVAALTSANREQFPVYFEELRGTADGAEVPFIQVFLINMRKEIAPFLATPIKREKVGEADQCSTILLNTESLAVIAHNEDADVSLLNHAYLVHAEFEDGLSFVAYTYAGELPSCAFGFNSHGVVFTLNAVPLAPEEAVAGGICRNFISRDLLEASNHRDALKRVCLSNRSVGHNYNIMDTNEGKMMTVEAASKGRWSVKEIGAEPFFHANMHRCADRYSKLSRDDMLSLLGDTTDEPYPVYMQGPKLVTLCTAVFDLYVLSCTIFQGNPEKQVVYSTLPLTLPWS
uniref:Peptidase C45 hydrolase domain-containing protein n=1 Tax=Physcomitrium patens TaxID=3218 RepID=A0A7I4EMF7_PHYPA